MSSSISESYRGATSGRFVRFLISSGVAALVNLASRYVLNMFMSFEAAVAVAFLFGVTTAYVLARLFVFSESGHGVGTEFRRFVTVNLVALVLVWCISVALATIVFPTVGFHWHTDLVAHFIGVASPTLVSYFAHQRYTFRAVGRAD
jgi:putative flippase GtrA